MGSNNKILITGGKGTVGKFLSSRLPYEILSPGKDELNLFDADQISSYLTKHNIDIVVHCGLTGREDLFSQEPHYTTDSLWMFRNLWNNKDKFKKFINLGTAYEFDLTQNNWLVREYDVLKHLPNTSYGYAKNLIARTIRETENFYNLRLFGVFHEAEADNRFFKKLFLNKQIDIHNDIYLDYIYLGDLLPVISGIVEDNIKSRDINMSYSKKYKMSELALIFCQAHNIDSTNVKVLGNNGLNLTGHSGRLDMYDIPLIGLDGFNLYKS